MRRLLIGTVAARWEFGVVWSALVAWAAGMLFVELGWPSGVVVAWMLAVRLFGAVPWLDMTKAPSP